MATENMCHAPAPNTFDEGRFRTVLGTFCSGLTVVTGTTITGEPVGFTCQAFASLSLAPPLVMICPSKASRTWPHLRATGRFCVNVLRRDQEDLSHRFATMPADRFAGISWSHSVRGVPMLDACLARVECEVQHEYDGGDHLIVVASVTDLQDNGGEPLVYFRGSYTGTQPVLGAGWR